MTNTDTLDTKASVEQCKKIIDAGAEMVRLTTQGIREAENLEAIKRELRRSGYDAPLVADVHFNPAVAETAARIVEKVRINPGNYTDPRALFRDGIQTDDQFAEGFEKARERFLPLIKICKQYGTAIRVGVNHGSLSDRIMMRYGNTPEGMARSAIEFLAILKDEGFANAVVSMKSSDPLVMVTATRLTVAMMQESVMEFPVHLGVTEAGEGEDGRILSAAGIGMLLAEGIGDTIRVSLSEAPEDEIPVARKIVSLFPGRTIIQGSYQSPASRPAVEGFRHPVVLGENGSKNRSDLSLDQFNSKYSVSDARIYSFNSPDDISKATKFITDHYPLPVILNPRFTTSSLEELVIESGVTMGRFFIESMAAGLIIDAPAIKEKALLTDLAFTILQTTGARITRNRYLSCPTCGRTKFNLLEAVKKVKEATSHTKGLKIAVMGCVVNGPGEMAGADWGYVGAGQGKVHIYKGLTPVMKNVPEDKAVEELVKLIEDSSD